MVYAHRKAGQSMRAPARMLVLSIGSIVLAMSGTAAAATHRIAVVLGNNLGGPTEKPLHYAEEDASKVAEVLVQLGDVAGERLYLLKGRGLSDFRQVLSQVAGLVARLRLQPD